MFKSIIKEIFIIILLIIAIGIVLGIMFYDYIPNSKKVPSTVTPYVLSEEMTNELEETIEASKSQNIISTYKVDASDLKRYEKTNDYDKGRVNPFGAIDSEQNNNNNTNNSNTSGEWNNNQTTNSNNSDGKLFNQVK